VTEVDRLGWVVTVPLRAGTHVLGVRTTTLEAGDLLRELFTDRFVPDADPPANLSLLLAPFASDGPQPLHRLYVTHRRVLRTRSARRALDALWHELDVRDVAAARQRMLLDATVVVRDGAAHVLPASMRREVVDDRRRWEADGFEVVDRRLVDLDPVAGTVTVPPSGLGSGMLTETTLAATGVAHRPEASQPVGTLPILDWALPPGTRSPAGRVVAAAGQVVDRPAHDGATMLAGLTALLATLPDRTGTVAQDVRPELSAG
jgi:hypothetical protein